MVQHGVAAKNLNRNFIGIELDKKYFEIAENMEEEIKEDQYIQYLKAQSQIEAKKYIDAIETLKKITKLYGENPFFLFDIACCYEELGNEKMYKYYCEKRDQYWKNHKND